jgi:hypothetical protein
MLHFKILKLIGPSILRHGECRSVRFGTESLRIRNEVYHTRSVQRATKTKRGNRSTRRALKSVYSQLYFPVKPKYHSFVFLFKHRNTRGCQT